MRVPPVLVVNAGSSSLKIKVLPQEYGMLVERIGGRTAVKANFTTAAAPPLTRHDEALGWCLDALGSQLPLADLVAVGHRVVHGGERYSEPVVVDDEVFGEIERLADLAPLHNPANAAGIAAARHLLADLPHVAVFDTAFHAALPEHAFLYGLPRRYYEQQGIRKYGFHGTSHDYVTRKAAEILRTPREHLCLVSLHLGNGASAAAVQRGRSIDTSMGLTPLDGLLMGTRTGEIDPGVLLHLLRRGMALEELSAMLNTASGLRGLSGVSNDMRDVREAAGAGNTAARQALAVFTYRIRKTVAAYAAAMGGLDGIVFTGGIGENDSATRSEALRELAFLGVHLDEARNRRHDPIISAEGTRVAVLVVATDEERVIALATRRALGMEVVG